MVNCGWIVLFAFCIVLLLGLGLFRLKSWLFIDCAEYRRGGVVLGWLGDGFVGVTIKQSSTSSISFLICSWTS